MINPGHTMADNRLIRAFFALELPPDIREWLDINIVESLKKLPVHASWVARKNIHLTVRFLGDIDTAQKIDLLSLDFGAIGAIDMALSTLGTFGGNKPRVVWVGLEGETYKLHSCRNIIENSCKSLGIAPDDKPLSPHITLARVKSPENAQLLTSEIKRIPIDKLTFTAKELTLFKSTLTPQGSIYEAMRRFKLS
jgi:RNA 2',3'-cyclic 3'-phosphodiesterase